MRINFSLSGKYISEVIILNTKYPDLISLIAQDREAMAYFKTLPDDIKCELGKNADKIGTIENLIENADHIKKRVAE